MTQAGLAWGSGGCSARLEEEDSDLTKVEVDEVLGLVGNVGAEVASHDAMPGGVVLLVELLLDESGDVLLNVEALEGLGRDVDSILLHVLGHVSVLDNSFAVSHSEVGWLLVWGKENLVCFEGFTVNSIYQL